MFYVYTMLDESESDIEHIFVFLIAKGNAWRPAFITSS